MEDTSRVRRQMMIRSILFAIIEIFGGDTLQDFVDRWQLKVHHEEVSPDMHINIILLNLVEILQLWETLQEFGNR